MRVEAGTGLGSRTRQITMTDNLVTGEHLMKDGQQFSQPFSLGRRTGAARQFVLVQSSLVSNADGTMVVRNGMSPYLQQHPVLRHRTVASDIGVIADNMSIHALFISPWKVIIIFYNRMKANLAMS